MGFENFQKHCSECKKGKPCGKYHVYVMTVDPHIWQSKRKAKFRKKNEVTYIQGMEMLYVGMSECTPRCRQSKHHNYRSDGKGRWTCYCGNHGETNEYGGWWDKPSTVVKNYLKNGYGLLKPKLFKHLNPYLTKNDAEDAEKLLANELRSRGFGVWAGHHDVD